VRGTDGGRGKAPILDHRRAPATPWPPSPSIVGSLPPQIEQLTLIDPEPFGEPVGHILDTNRRIVSS
jgi:hypothetical protein